MAITLEEFAAQCKQILQARPGNDGRQDVATRLQDVLKDEAFVSKHLGDDTPARKVLYEDPDLGFTILAHCYEDASESRPHDHGPSWAIYGQARGETEMTTWELMEAATPEKPGKVRRAGVSTLKPGIATVYNEGQLHSPKREGPTRLIRIEGVNMDRVKRLSYEAV
jgi:predicted metal-dependent enzyme (double-stranded beta helix superfamily)